MSEKRHPLVENLLSFAGEIEKKIAVDVVVEDLEDTEVRIVGVAANLVVLYMLDWVEQSGSSLVGSLPSRMDPHFME